MVGIDYIVIVLYFLGLIAVSVLVSRSIKSSADMFIAGRNSSWWLSGMSTYMTLFSASTFVIWGGVAFRSGFVAVLIGNILGFASFFVGRYLSSGIKSFCPFSFAERHICNDTIKFHQVAVAVKMLRVSECITPCDLSILNTVYKHIHSCANASAIRLMY